MVWMRGAEVVGVFEGLDVGARRHDLLDGARGELHDGLDHEAGALVEGAEALALFDHAEEFGLDLILGSLMLDAGEAADHFVNETSGGLEGRRDAFHDAEQDAVGGDELGAGRGRRCSWEPRRRRARGR